MPLDGPLDRVILNVFKNREQVIERYMRVHMWLFSAKLTVLRLTQNIPIVRELVGIMLDAFGLFGLMKVFLKWFDAREEKKMLNHPFFLGIIADYHRASGIDLKKRAMKPPRILPFFDPPHMMIELAYADVREMLERAPLPTVRIRKVRWDGFAWLGDMIVPIVNDRLSVMCGDSHGLFAAMRGLTPDEGEHLVPVESSHPDVDTLLKGLPYEFVRECANGQLEYVFKSP